MLETTAMGQAELARLLQDLEQGATPDDVGIAPQHLPANMPMAAMVACAIPAYGFSTDDFGKRAFDASVLGDDKAGVAMSADERDEEERKKNGGMTAAEALDDLVDQMSDITDAQKEAMAAYRETWLDEEHDYGGTSMTGRDIEDMNSRYRNDPRFRNSVHSRLRNEGMSLAEIQALEAASERKQILSQIPPHMLTPQQKAEYAAAQHNDKLNRFEHEKAEAYKSRTYEVKNNVTSDHDHETNVTPYADRLNDHKSESSDYVVQSNAAEAQNQPDIVRKEMPAVTPAAPMVATI